MLLRISLSLSLLATCLVARAEPLVYVANVGGNANSYQIGVVDSDTPSVDVTPGDPLQVTLPNGFLYFATMFAINPSRPESVFVMGQTGTACQLFSITPPSPTVAPVGSAIPCSPAISISFVGAPGSDRYLLLLSGEGILDVDPRSSEVPRAQPLNYPEGSVSGSGPYDSLGLITIPGAAPSDPLQIYTVAPCPSTTPLDTTGNDCFVSLRQFPDRYDVQSGFRVWSSGEAVAPDFEYSVSTGRTYFTTQKALFAADSLPRAPDAFRLIGTGVGNDKFGNPIELQALLANGALNFSGSGGATGGSGGGSTGGTTGTTGGSSGGSTTGPAAGGGSGGGAGAVDPVAFLALSGIVGLRSLRRRRSQASIEKQSSK